MPLDDEIIDRVVDVVVVADPFIVVEVEYTGPPAVVVIDVINEGPQGPPGEPGGIEEAPIDDQAYARLNAAWALLGDMVTTQSTEYLYNDTTAAPPASGQLRLDTADQTIATKAWLSNVNVLGVDITHMLDVLGPGKLVIQDKDNSTRWQRYIVTGPSIAMGGYHEFPIVFEAGGGPVPEQRIMAFAINSGVGEAPSDGKPYARSNGAWVALA